MYMFSDFNNEPLKVGDDVIFVFDGSLKRGTILKFFKEDNVCVDTDTNLSYIRRTVIEPNSEVDYRTRVYAYVGIDGKFDEDHYGKTIEDTFHYLRYKEVAPFNLIKNNRK